MKSFIEDWREMWPSLLLGVLILLGFSQGWECPIFGYGTTQAAEDGGLIRDIYYPVYLCGAGLAFIAWRRLLDATWRTPLLLALIGLCLVSVLWSIEPSTTVRRFVALVMTCLGAYALASRFSWRRLCEVIALTFLILAIASYIMAIALPAKGRMTELFPGTWRGVWNEKNNLGAAMAIGFVSAAAAAVHNPVRRWWWWGASTLMLGLVLLSTSKTALLSLMLGTGGIGALWLARRGPVTGVLVVWGSLTAMMSIAAIVLLEPALLFAALGKDATLTGRTFIWDGIMRQIQTRPLTGFGYGAVWTTEGKWTPLAKIVNIAGFRPYHAHSCWLEVWLGEGIIGLVLWSLVLAEAWLKGLWRAYKGDGGLFALPFLGMYTLASLTESMGLAWNDVRWCLVVLVIVKLSLKGDVDSDAVRGVLAHPQSLVRPKALFGTADFADWGPGFND